MSLIEVESGEYVREKTDLLDKLTANYLQCYSPCITIFKRTRAYELFRHLAGKETLKKFQIIIGG